MTVTLDSLVCRSEAPLTAEVDGEVLMMSVQTGNYYGLDEVGSFIWNRIAEPVRVRAVCDAIEAAFDVERERCERDTVAFLSGMVKDGLVRHAE